MKSPAVWVLLATLISQGALPAPLYAQFNPAGRKKSRPSAGSSAKPDTRRAQPSLPRRASSANATSDAAPESKAPTSAALIARYTAIVLAQPGAEFPLSRLAQLYRERDGNLDALVKDFDARAGRAGNNENALVALGGIYKLQGDPERALSSYAEAAKRAPTSPVPLQARAALEMERGDKAAAFRDFEKVLPLLSADAEREQTLRSLRELALDLKDWELAKKYQRALIVAAKGSTLVRTELARDFFARGEYARAVGEYRDVLRASGGDNRVLAPVLKDLGRALAKAGDPAEASQVLDRALRAAGSQSGIRREILDALAELYRSQNKLGELIARLEQQGTADADGLRLLARLQEEAGLVKAALATYRRVLRVDGKDLATRVKIIQLLQLEGELDAALREYEALVRVAPENADYVFQYAEALLQRGNRAKAVAELDKFSARARGDEDLESALVEFYERIDEKARARELLQRLAASGSRDPRHLSELGDRYWQDGDKKKAVLTWQRIRTSVPDRALAESTLGDVYLEHDMAREGLDALREAVRLAPANLKYRKSYALALERTGAAAATRDARLHQYDEARKIWDELSKRAGGDANLAREARQHIVTLWSLSGQLPERMPALAKRLHATPPDLEAGRLLAEAQVRRRENTDAERTLSFIVQHETGDVQSLTTLERVLVQQRKLREAIAVLQRLVQTEPRRAREFYERMAEYAAELYRDDEAIGYAEKAVALSPDEAEGHKKLGEMYEKRQDSEHAIAAFRRAISKNDRLFPVYLELAELLLARGSSDEADQLLRHVIRSSPDEELTLEAARLSMQINLGRGTLESLEKELLPLALGNAGKPLYRRLLVEVYGAISFPLVEQAKSSDPQKASRAREELRRVGERAVKPLLDALGDERGAEQRIAIELLEHIENKGAGAALFAYATGNADPDLRVRAMLALGSLRDPELLAKLSQLLAPRDGTRPDESDPVVLAAALSVVRMRSEAARPLLTKLLNSESPDLRALAALGVALNGDRSAEKALAGMARSHEFGAAPRAAAAFALGEIRAHGETELLRELSQSNDVLLCGAALIALARIQSDLARPAVAGALVSADPELQSAGVSAAGVLAKHRYDLPAGALDVPAGRVEVRPLLERLTAANLEPAERARALIDLSPELAKASAQNVRNSSAGARAVAEALVTPGDAPAFLPLLPDLAVLAPELRRRSEQAIEIIAQAAVPAFVAVAENPAPEMRSLALRFLATRGEAEAGQALLRALADSDESVQHAALNALEKRARPGAATALARLLETSPSWPLRVHAADALARFGQAAREPHTLDVLIKSAEHDEYALVREAAVKALGRVGGKEARPVLLRVASFDAEPRVQRAAQVLLNGP